MNRTPITTLKTSINTHFDNKQINGDYILGTWALGGHHFGKYDQKNAIEVLNYCFDHHIRAYDIATFYAKGNSNIVLKKFLQKKNINQCILCAKSGLKWKKNEVLHDGSEKHLKKELDRLLNEFNTDYIDIFLLHWPDPKIELAESIETLQKLKAEKKVKFIGLCNITEKNIDVIDTYNLDTIHIQQSLLSQKTTSKHNKVT